MSALTAETVRSTSHLVGDAIEAGRDPDMSLGILTKLVREAPLPSQLLLSVMRH
jgi:hypothetical protein